MELPTETGIETVELSQYEIERNKPMPSKNHSIVQGNLITALNVRYRKAHSFFSELDIVMPQKPNCVPDIAIYPKLKIDFLDDVIGMTDMPITAIEIVSSSQSDYEIVRKINRYFQAGVKSCWLVNPPLQAISVYSEIGKYTFFNTDMILTDPVTGIELPLAEVFAD
ncbi:MAG: Uma2 family endonuclease [Bacteroidetes bacterium]|nr:Uma2 family endonuclease [Fibrella sp.]